MSDEREFPSGESRDQPQPLIEPGDGWPHTLAEVDCPWSSLPLVGTPEGGLGH